MIAYCNYSPEAIWVREIDGGLRKHITLRRNIIKESVTRQDVEETQFQFEEIDVYIPDRDNLQEYIAGNFDSLFTLGIQQTVDNQILEINKEKSKILVDSGQISVDLDSLQSQVLIILGV